MVSMTDSKRAAERYADNHTAYDRNYVWESMLTRDETFQALAVALHQLDVADVYGDVLSDEVADHAHGAVEEIVAAMAVRAGEVFREETAPDATKEVTA